MYDVITSIINEEDSDLLFRISGKCEILRIYMSEVFRLSRPDGMSHFTYGRFLNFPIDKTVSTPRNAFQFKKKSDLKHLFNFFMLHKFK